jgi:hypothetical protein
VAGKAITRLEHLGEPFTSEYARDLVATRAVSSLSFYRNGSFDVVGVEHGRKLALLEDRLLIRLGGGVVVQRQLQLGVVRLLG